MTQRSELPKEASRLTALGLRLRHAREALQITEIGAARQLFLSVGQVRALEEARYDELPAEVFVRGYLRSYARLLGLDPDDILRQYRPPGGVSLSAVDGGLGASGPAQPSSTSAGKPANLSPGAASTGTMNLLEAMPRPSAAMFSAWGEWIKRLGRPSMQDLEAIPDRTLMALSGVAIALVIGIVLALLFFSGERSDDVQSGLGGQTSDRTLTADPELFEVIDDAARLDISLPSSGERSADEARTQAPEGASESAGGHGGAKILEMAFSADCWVEVKDASRKILLADMRRAGDREVFQGEPPYKVLLGRTEAVTIHYGGQPLLIEPDQGKDYTSVVIGG